MKQQKKDNTTRREFLLTFFDKEHYEEKEVNGFWLVKMYDNTFNRWQVAIYNQDNFNSYRAYKEYLKGKK